MNSSLKSVIIFVSGAAVGASSMYFGLKKYFEVKADLEIEEVRRVYDDKINEIEGVKSSLEGEIEGESEIDDGKDSDKKPLSHKEIIEKLNNKPDLTDYTKYFKEKGDVLPGVNETLRDAKEAADKEGLTEEELAEREGPQDDEPYSDEEDRDETLRYEDHVLNGASKDAIENDKEPYEIDPSDFALTCDSYDKISLTWYHFDQVLVNEEEELVDGALLVGHVIEQTGFDQNEDDVLYIRNDKIMTDFEITKVYEQYGREK